MNIFDQKARSANIFMDIFDSLMDIFDQEKKSFMTKNYDSFIIIFDKK